MAAREAAGPPVERSIGRLAFIPRQHPALAHLGCPLAEPDSLYSKLESVIAPLFYRRPLDSAEVMRGAMALNGSFFNAQRMLIQYLRNAYLPGNGPAQPDPLIPALAPYLSGSTVGLKAPG